YLSIQVQQQPQLSDYEFTGVKKKYAKDLEKEIPLLKGATVRPSDLERSKQVIKNYFKEKGFMLAEVDVQREQAGPNAVTLNFIVDRGPRVEVENIVIEGNEEVSARKLRKQMDETKED